MASRYILLYAVSLFTSEYVIFSWVTFLGKKYRLNKSHPPLITFGAFQCTTICCLQNVSQKGWIENNIQSSLQMPHAWCKMLAKKGDFRTISSNLTMKLLLTFYLNTCIDPGLLNTNTSWESFIRNSSRRKCFGFQIFGRF